MKIFLSSWSVRLAILIAGIAAGVLVGIAIWG